MWKSANSESVMGPDGTRIGSQVKRDERGTDSSGRLAAGRARHGSSASAKPTASVRRARADGGFRVVMVGVPGRVDRAPGAHSLPERRDGRSSASAGDDELVDRGLAALR